MRSLCFPLILFCFCLGEYNLRAQDCLPFEEIHLLASMPEAVSNNAVCAGYVNDEPYIYSFGGIDTTKADSGIHLKSWRYDVLNDSWQSLPNLPDTMGKIAASATYLDGIIYIVGGYHVFSNNSEVSSLLVHRFDCDNNTFLSDAAPLPIPIDDQVQSVWRDSLVFVMTGWSNNGNVTQLQIYDPIADSWSNQFQPISQSVYGSFGANGVIVEDTIYYLGGYRFGSSSPVQPYLRKGVIDPNNLLNVTWSHQTVGNDTTLYRPAAFDFYGTPTWIGGSQNSYNYDGIAYDGSGGVDPAMKIIQANANDVSMYQCTYARMDLRGSAWFPERGELYIAGGMAHNQGVSNKLTRLSISEPVAAKAPAALKSQLRVYPNPARGQVTIESEQPMRIYSVTGQLVLELASGQTTVRLYQGIYTVIATDGNSSEKLVVME